MNKSRSLAVRITQELKKVIVEQDELIELSLVGLLCGGNVLLEGVPGLAKTLFVKALAHTIRADFKRIQFTPDLMPADLTGTKIFNLGTREFELKKGPIFTNFLLADEINRTPPKTQAGLLEAMAENTVTIDGEIHLLTQPYMVFATQNPLEFEGTYPLPEALVDRFSMKLLISYPSFQGETEILKRYHTGSLLDHPEECGVTATCSSEDLLAARSEVQRVSLQDELLGYIISIISETRVNPMIDIGSSPRGALSLLQASKAFAAINGRDFVLPEDIKKMTLPTLRHRIVLKPELELEGVRTDEVLLDILSKIKVPR